MWNPVDDIPGFLHSLHGPSHASHSTRRASTSGSGSRGHSFSVLHPNDCSPCHSYKVHLIYASLQEDGTSPGYAEAESYLGLSQDQILHELYQVRTHLRRIRLERNGYRNKVALLENQLREAKDRILAMEIAYDEEAQQRNANFLGEESLGEEYLHEEADYNDGFETLNDILDADLGMDDWTIERSPNIQTETFPDTNWNDPSEDYDLIQQLHLIIQRDLEENHWEDDYSNDPLQNHHPQVDSTLPVYCADSSSNSPSTSSSLLASDSDDSYSPPASSTSSNTELQNMLKLMASAHEEGNTTALIQIKKLIVQSERTPGHKRTDAQKYLLLNWRSPSFSGRNNNMNSTKPALPSSQGLPEMFVDASGSGIGFVFGAKWLAWTFKRTREISLGGDGKINMSWAELLAVELGLRSLIAAGHQSTTVILRSDNMGVIDALKKKSWCPRHGLEEILQNILRLCEEYRINLTPRWVSTKDNLADDPSRGVFPPQLYSFEFPPTLPERLSNLLELAVPATA